MIILTDSTADIRNEEVEKMNIRLVHLNVLMDGTTYQDSKTIMPDEFYQKLEKTNEFPKTSQPAPSEFLAIFEEAKEKDEELIYLGVSSGLSGTFNSACVARDMADYDKLYLVDTLESIQGLRLLVKVACKMRDEGAKATEIVEKINYLKNHVHIYSMIDTLEYLYRGGRLSKAAAVVGNLINLKPLIDLDKEGKIRNYGKAFGVNRALIDIMKSIKENPMDYNYPVCFGYTYGTENLDKLMSKVLSTYEVKDYDVSQIGPAIGSHIGPRGFCIMYVSDKERK